MLIGPWLTTRSPIPSARVAAGSQWIGLGSRSSAAIVFISALPTCSTTRGAI
jgi:hypothetical protein